MKAIRYRQFALLCLLGLVIPPVYAEAENTEALDIESITKKWKCKYCPDLSEEQWEGYISISPGYVTNDSYKFGEYTGLNKKGAYLRGDVDALYRDDEGYYWDIKGRDLGLDSSYFDAKGGRQGKYKLELEVDQITRNFLDTGRTPYSGDSIQTLPAGWVNAPTTAGFTTLYDDLRDVNFSTQRRHFKMGGEYISSKRWSYEAWFKHQTKQGNQPRAFSFGFNRSATLNQPIDYTTDDIDLKANYNYADFNGQIAVSYSQFNSGNNPFRWDNAYDSPVGAPQGQASNNTPDNSKQQILLSGNYSGIDNVQLTGLFSYAQLKQNETFLPYTVNGSVNPPPLPQKSLNGKVAVFNTNLGAHWQYSPQQAWHLTYEGHEQDNNTARNTYTYVTADSAVTGTPRANTPYSFRNQNLKLSTDYKFTNKIKLSGGGKFSKVDRTYQSVEHTQETSLWAKFKQRIDYDLQYSFKTEYIDRKIDDYNPADDVIPADNPLMRKYYISDRKGYKIDFNLGYSLTDSVLFNFTSDIARYDYDATIGLTESDELSLGFDVQYMVDEDLSFGGFVQNTTIKSQQAGSQTYSTPDWFASNDDNVLTLGLDTSYQVIEDKLKIGADYVHAESSAAIDVSVGDAFPDLTTKRDTIYLYADYNIDEELVMKASYQYEKYREDNWYVDDVAPDTLANVLTLGERAPSYKIGVIWLSLRYNY